MKNSKYSVLVLFFIFVFSVLFSFQNCSSYKANNPNGVSSLATPTPPPSPTPTPGLLPPGLPPANGACNSPLTLNGCAPGSNFMEMADSATQYIWNCNGTNGGTNATCAMTIPVSQAPICGTAAQSTCTRGVFTDRTDSATQYLWNCESGGTVLGCALNKPGVPATPSCGSTKNTCNNSIFSDIADSPTEYLWTCSGVASTCHLPLPGTEISCTVSAPAVTHYNESLTYQFTAPVGITLPNPSHIKIFGTKMVNGTTTTDETGSTVISVNPAAVTVTNNGTTTAGKYTRRFTIYNPANNQEVCHTNTIDQLLTPVCGFTLTPNTITYDQGITFAVNLSTNPALLGTPVKLIWFGTKNGVQDENGGEFVALSAYPYLLTGFSAANIGTYTRYYHALDSQNKVLCRSYTATATINDVPAAPDPVAEPPPSGGGD